MPRIIKVRRGSRQVPVDAEGMDAEMERTLTQPNQGIQVPDWLAGIGNMLSGKKKAAAPTPAKPPKFNSAQEDSILNRSYRK